MEVFPMARSLAAVLVTFALLSACGGSSKDPATPDETNKDAAAKGDASGDTEAKSDESAGKTEGGADTAADTKPKEPAKAASETETLARDIVKGGGRRIGFSATKKMFAVPNEKRTETNFGLDVFFYGDDGASRDPMRVCQLGECEEHMSEKLDEVLPKLVQKLDEGGFVSVRGVGWPDGKDELEVSSLGMKLKFKSGRLEGLREGKPPVVFQVAGGRLDVAEIKAIYLPTDSKLMGLFGKPSRSTGAVQVFYVLKVP
jgi:hypothetical protein